MLTVVLSAALAITVTPRLGHAQDAKVYSLHDGETQEIYWGLNLSGSVYLSIRGPAGSGCARVFWRPYSFIVQTISLGELCGNVKLEIPGLSSFAVGGGLWARANKGNIKIIGSSNESVANKFPEVSFP